MKDGILTCHWHHARFDLASGGTFDPWADDVTTYEVVIEDDVVYVDPRPRSGDRTAYWKGRLRDGLEQNLNLVLVKNVLNLIEAGTPPAEILEVGGVFGTTYRAGGWSTGWCSERTSPGRFRDGRSNRRSWPRSEPPRRSGSRCPEEARRPRCRWSPSR